MRPNISNAIRALGILNTVYSSTETTIEAWDIAEEPSGVPQPTQGTIDAKLVELQAEYDAQAYARDRQYPAIGDQLDALFHAGVFPAEMAATLQAVKDAHPKA